MSRRLVGTVRVLSILLLVVTAAVPGLIRGEEVVMPPARQIPGINAEDHFPLGCVDCHVKMPERNMDVRLSTILAKWAVGVEPDLLPRIGASIPADTKLKGKHPVVTDALQDIPAGCITCHDKSAKSAPPFAELMHLIHLDGGEGNHFMTVFQGECTFCHKFDATGKWSVPSGPEK